MKYYSVMINGSLLGLVIFYDMIFERMNIVNRDMLREAG